MYRAWAGSAAVLLASLPAAEAQVLGLTDPKLCYILDGMLFLYGIIITALFVREKLTKIKEPPVPREIEDIYNKLAPGQRDEYDVLMKASDDAEKGAKLQTKRRNPQNAVYSGLQKDKMAEPYSEIRVKVEQRKRGKGNEGIYQGLNPATTDTYDTLQMQPLPARER